MTLTRVKWHAARRSRKPRRKRRRATRTIQSSSLGFGRWGYFDKLAGIGGSPDKADKIKNINVTIEKVIDKFEIHTTNMHEDIGKVKEMVAEALTGAVNDVNYAM